MNNITNIDDVSSNNLQLDIITMYKMTFVYNALLNGWTVRKLKNNKFEFSKNKEEIKKEVYLDNFLNKFINANINVNHIISNDELTQ
tara:strand:+ start:463 stop:723 length:261 start_codon:yes stop_codon:yes gene_type:complete